jgi:hypothetical protein
MDHIISLITFLLLTLLGLVLQVIGFIDGLLSAALTSIGVPLHAQEPLLIIAAILLAVAALQLLGRFVAGLLLVLFVLLLLAPHAPKSWIHTHDQAPTLTLPGPHVTM